MTEHKNAAGTAVGRRIADRLSAQKAAASGGKRVQQTPKRFRRKLTRKEMLIILVPAVLTVIAVAAAMLLMDKAVTYTVEGEAYQYYAGGSYSIPDGSELRQGTDDSFLIEIGKDTRNLPDLPIYYKDRNTLVLTRNMVYYAPREGICARSDFFTEVSCTKYGTVEMSREGEQFRVDSGFLYNGEDFYIFLEPVVVSFNGYIIELPAMSYVEAVYGNMIMVYNYETGEFFMDTPRSTVTAQIAEGDYVIALLNDSMTLYNGTKSLLFTRPELLDPVKGV